MSVRRASKSSISTTDRGKGSNLIAGYSPAVDEMDLLTRVELGTSTPSVTVNSIPQTYRHLRIHMLARSDGIAGDGSWSMQMRFGYAGTPDSGSNYTDHRMYSDIGSGVVGADSRVSQTSLLFDRSTYGNANIFGACVMDILDYTSTTKNKVTRSIGGSPTSFQYDLYSNTGLWVSTNPIDTIVFFPRASATSFSQYTSISLYGVLA